MIPEKLINYFRNTELRIVISDLEEFSKYFMIEDDYKRYDHYIIRSHNNSDYSITYIIYYEGKETEIKIRYTHEWLQLSIFPCRSKHVRNFSFWGDSFVFFVLNQARNKNLKHLLNI